MPLAIIGAFAIAVNLHLIQNNKEEADRKEHQLRSNLIEQQKKIIKHQVDQIARQIEAEKNRTINKLKYNIKQHVDDAYSIANNLYITHQNQPKEQIVKLISEALRSIRFNDGRGYLFIFQMNGINVMHGLNPDLEGSSAWNAQDKYGTYILREHIDLIKDNGGEAFYHWWYKKPNEDPSQEFEKIGFGRYFAPFDWFIGSGEYVEDVENDEKKEVLSWLNNSKYKGDDYIFILDNKLNVLSHPDPALLGAAASTALDSVIANLFEKQDKDEGFIRYNARYMPGEKDGGEKISYIKTIADWNWIIGSGFYTQRFEDQIADSIAALQKSSRDESLKISLISIVSTLLVIALSLTAGNLIAYRFNRFQSRITRDFNELEQAKNKLKHLAEHDPLTNLPNRLVLNQMIRDAIRLAKSNNQILAIIFVDLDDFKKINDLYGHTLGDKLLKTMSRKFETLLGPHDSVSRFGGDEFIFCFSELHDVQHAHDKVAAIRQIFQDKLLLDQRALTINCSIGISLFPDDSHDPESLIRNADIALHKSKHSGKNHSLFFNLDMNAEVQFNYTIEEELRNAVIESEMAVCYQPQIDVKSGELIGVEALCRWHNQRLGNVPPDKFIKVAEDIGLIHEIGLFVFRKACEDILAASPNGKQALNISINISPKQLIVPHFSERLLNIVHTLAIDISRITLEVTENVLLEDLKHTSGILHQLRNYGFGISLDDFGTGYSSLSYLNNLPITEIKIDRSFIEQLLVIEQSDTLVKAIIAIGNSCNMLVVAEGVETHEQYQKLLDYGCDLVQGYYFSPPLTIDNICQKYNRCKVSC